MVDSGPNLDDVEIGSKRDDSGPNEANIGPYLVGSRPNLRSVGEFGPKFGRLAPNSVEAGPTNLGEHRPTSTAPIAVKFGPSKFGGVDRIRPELRRLRRVSRELARPSLRKANCSMCCSKPRRGRAHVGTRMLTSRRADLSPARCSKVISSHGGAGRARRRSGNPWGAGQDVVRARGADSQQIRGADAIDGEAA